MGGQLDVVVAVDNNIHHWAENFRIRSSFSYFVVVVSGMGLIQHVIVMCPGFTEHLLVYGEPSASPETLGFPARTLSIVEGVCVPWLGWAYGDTLLIGRSVDVKNSRQRQRLLTSA